MTRDVEIEGWKFIEPGLEPVGPLGSGYPGGACCERQHMRWSLKACCERQMRSRRHGCRKTSTRCSDFRHWCVSAGPRRRRSLKSTEWMLSGRCFCCVWWQHSRAAELPCVEVAGRNQTTRTLVRRSQCSSIHLSRRPKNASGVRLWRSSVSSLSTTCSASLGCDTRQNGTDAT